MAHSRGSWLAAALLGTALAQAAPVQLDVTAPIHAEAKSSDLDYKNSKFAFHTVKVTQGGFSIEADEATANGMDAKDSQWLFQGDVRIVSPDGSIACDEAHIVFAANAVTTAEITGKPATFEQRRDKIVARGHANHILYDFGAGTVRLSDGATLTDGDREISGRTLIYDMRQQKLRANSDEQGGGPVVFTINPKKPDPKPKP